MTLFARNPSIATRLFSRELGTHPADARPGHVTSPAETRPANECAQCGEAIFMPEWSEWLNPACARHLWQCEACGYSFETTVRFAAA